jgi:hypothetical protein
MARKRQATDRAGGKREARRAGSGASAPDATPRRDPGGRLVDVDPWAMLLEGLMGLPEEDATAEREGGKRG